MTVDDFRRIALSLERAEEGSHMGQRDFRVGGGIFATLTSASRGYGTVKLTPEQQTALAQEMPEVFVPVPGDWGRAGMSHVRLAAASEAVLAGALLAAWKLRVEKNAKPRRRRRSGQDDGFGEGCPQEASQRATEDCPLDTMEESDIAGRAQQCNNLRSEQPGPARSQRVQALQIVKQKGNINDSETPLHRSVDNFERILRRHQCKVCMNRRVTLTAGRQQRELMREMYRIRLKLSS
jgi:hypothetical protein